MAFCNSCGTSLTPGTKFCSKCGATVPLAAVPAAIPATPIATASAPTGGGGALKVILIVVAVIVVIGVLSVASIGFFAWRIAHRTHVTQEGNHVKVETPFGSAETSGDSTQAASNLGLDIYPGAEIQKNGASTASFGGIHTVTAVFESSDSLDKVCAFYKSRFPNAMVSTTDQNRCSIISNDSKSMITIHLEPDGSNTKIQITNVSKNTGTKSSSSE
jgi:flagellar basal body-associated protein FliL